eukprot:g194.t1
MLKNDDGVGPLPRRARFKHRREGTGRETTRRKFNLTVGRRTGVAVKTNVKRDATGTFDDIDDFWGSPEGGESGRKSNVASEDTPLQRRSSIDSEMTPFSTGNTDHKSDSNVIAAETPGSVDSPGGFSVGETTTPGPVLEEGGNDDLVNIDEEPSFDASTDMVEPPHSYSEEDEEEYEIDDEPKPTKKRKGQKQRRKKAKNGNKRKRVMHTPVGNRASSPPRVTAKKRYSPAPNPRGLRRSGRTRFKPLKYWKNERIEFEADPLTREQVLVGARREGVPTPLLKKSDRTPGPKTPAAERKKKRGRKKKKVDSQDSHMEVKREKPVKLPRGFEENDRSQAMFKVMTAKGTEYRYLDAVQRQENLMFRDLPSQDHTRPRPKACGAFDDPSMVSGLVKLEPGAAKDLESVRGCTQVFYVVEGQDRSIEFQVGERSDDSLPFLLSAGDHFCVRPHNSYSLVNHSSETDAVIHFVVVKP